MAIPDFVPIKDHEGLVRDTRSMAVINTDSEGLAKAKLQKQLALQRMAQERAKETELNNLKKDVAQIKDTLQLILAKLSEK